MPKKNWFARFFRNSKSRTILNGKLERVRLSLDSLEDRVVFDANFSVLGSDASSVSPLINPEVFTGGVFVAAGDVTGDGYADIVTGAGPGGGPHVRVFDGKSGQIAWEFMAYDPNFRGGVSVAIGDVNGDGRLDIVTGAGPGGGPHIKVFDSITRSESLSFYSFDAIFLGGVRVAVGDTDGDGKAEIAVTGGNGGTAEVRLFSGLTGRLLTSIQTETSENRNGATVALADFTQDGKADLVVGSGGGVTQVQVFDLNSGNQQILSIAPYDPGFVGTVWVAAGDITGDGIADIITGAGLGGGPHVRVFDGKSQADAGSWMAYSPDFRGGLFVAVADLNADGKLDVVTGAGPGGGPHVGMFDSNNQSELESFFAYAPLSFTNGFSAEIISKPSNSLPFISRIADQSSQGDVVGPLSFSVGDLETPDTNLMVMATSSNPALLVGIIVNGVGGNRTLTLTPTLGLSGTSTITITVTDGNGGTVSEQFQLIVTATIVPPPPPNTAPTISNVADQTSDGNVIGPIVFTVGDAETPANDLVVTATSSVPGLANIVLTGSGSSRTISIAPISGRTGSSTITITVTDGNGVSTSDQLTLTITPVLEPQPELVSLADFGTAMSFLYRGPNAVQTGVAEGVIEPLRAAVVRGRILGLDGSPLSAVVVTVLNHPEFGQSMSRADGSFDLVVNGGGQLSVVYTKAGFLAIQRSETIPWRDFAILLDVALTPLDDRVTTIDLSSGSTLIQVARGSVETDSDGSRQATILFPQGVQATMTLPNGTSQTLTTLDVRATEYTVGESGPMAMPGTLPPTSGYTYAVELSVDQAIAAGATRVDFSQAVPVYVDNFLDFPVGMIVPAGYFDRGLGQWIASDNGRVIKILSETANDVVLDTDGDGIGDTATVLAQLGITAAERGKLVELFDPGQSFWRTPVNHFSIYDFNWPFGPPSDAKNPQTNSGGLPDGSVRNPSTCDGSIIEMENQVLRETIPISGTPYSLNYSSARAVGNQADRNRIIQLSGASIPASVKQIELSVSVAGREFTSNFAPATNMSTTFTWDGKDAYGRLVSTATNAIVDISYLYDGQYYQPGEAAKLFGANGISAISGNRARSEISIHQKIETRFGAYNASRTGLAGATLSIHHTYDSITNRLQRGDGTVQQVSEVIQKEIRIGAGTGVPGFSGDGGPVSLAQFNGIRDLAVDPSGNIYVVDSGNSRIRRISKSGIVSTFAGKDNPLGIATGNGVLATQAMFRSPISVASSPTGDVFVADFYGNRILRVDPEGILTTFVGRRSDSGPLPVVDTGIEPLYPRAVTVGPDGSVYYSEHFTHRIHKVSPDGAFTTIAGNGSGVIGSSGDGGFAINANLYGVSDLAIGPDGSVYISQSKRIRRITPDGIIRTVAGGGGSSDFPHLEGVSATSAYLSSVDSLSISRDGSIVFSDPVYNRIRRVTSDGILNTIAGNASLVNSTLAVQDGMSALQAPIGSASGLTISPNGNVYIANATKIFTISSPKPDSAFDDFLVPSENATELYLFNAGGRHLQTLDALTRTPIYTFAYDSMGRLIFVTDTTGNITRIEHDSTGKPTAIVAPFGQRTTLAANINGYLTKVTNPANESHFLEYAQGGLLKAFVDPRGNTSVMTYDAEGRLTRDADPINGFTQLTRTELGNGSYKVTNVNAVNGTREYKVEFLPDGSRRRTSIDGRGFATVSVKSPDGTERIVTPDGTITTTTYGPDPRFGMLAPVATKQTVTLPSGLTSTVAGSRTAVFSIPGDRTSPITSLTTTAVVNGRTFTSVYDAAAHTILSTSAAGREATTLLDSLGRTSRVTLPEIEPTNYTYDARGRIDTISQAGRIVRNSYDAAGRLATITDPLGRTTRFEYDAADRITKQTQPDSTFILFRYDIAGNLVGLTPPGQLEHVFTYDNRNAVSSETPPPVGASDDSTRYVYNAARQLAQQSLPGGQIISYAYCDCGRITGTTTPWGQYDYIYSTSTGELASIASPGGFTVSFGLDGGLVTSEITTGPVPGRIDRTFDNNFRVTSERVNNGSAVSFAYDADGLLTQAGALTLNRSSNLGRIDSTYIGTNTAGVVESLTYNALGEVGSYSATWNAQPRLAFDYTRDDLGRITRKVDSVNGTGKTIDYGYDLNGQLTSVTENGVVTQQYAYDPNGNRLSLITPTGTVAGVYDAQDRLLNYGTKSYTYDVLGSLKQVTDTATGQITRYQYDAFKNLTRVELPDGKVIEYLIDGQNRRVGKKVDGVLVEGLVYNGQLRPVAKLDGAGNIVERFVYSTGINVPAYMVKDGVNYRLVTDHLGSVRMVINVQTGVVAQRLDYDAFGRVTLDTNPGFQPFGFAGGLYDVDTGLVRFGARDYDAESGRWTAKDPIGFSGGINVYVYAANSPGELIDPSGHESQTSVPAELKGNIIAAAQQDHYLSGLVDSPFSTLPFGLAGTVRNAALTLPNGSIAQILGLPADPNYRQYTCEGLGPATTQALANALANGRLPGVVEVGDVTRETKNILTTGYHHYTYITTSDGTVYAVDYHPTLDINNPAIYPISR